MNNTIFGVLIGVFAAAGGAIVGGLFDSPGEHIHAQALGGFAGIAAFLYYKAKRRALTIRSSGRL